MGKKMKKWEQVTFITSIDRDGFLNGFDLELCKRIKNSVKLPVLALEVVEIANDMLDAFKKTEIDAVCTQNIFHFTEESIKSSKIFLDNNNVNVRKLK